MPTNSKISFFENLLSAFELNKNAEFVSLEFNELIKYSKDKGLQNEISILKIIIPKRIQSDILSFLREMNITAENLFPGLDGLAKSLVLSHIMT